MLGSGSYAEDFWGESFLRRKGLEGFQAMLAAMREFHPDKCRTIEDILPNSEDVLRAEIESLRATIRYLKSQLVLALNDKRPNQDSASKVMQIITSVASKHGLLARDLQGRRGSKHIVAARHEAMSLVHDECAISLSEIGRSFGNRDRATVLNGIRQFKSLKGACQGPESSSTLVAERDGSPVSMGVTG